MTPNSPIACRKQRYAVQYRRRGIDKKIAQVHERINHRWHFLHIPQRRCYRLHNQPPTQTQPQTPKTTVQQTIKK